MRKNVLGTLLSQLKCRAYKNISEFIFSKYKDGTWIEQQPKWLYTFACYLWNSTHWDGRWDCNLKLIRTSFPIIRRVFPELIASEIVSVQPMSGPVGLAFVLKYFYEDDIQKEDESDEAFHERMNPVPRIGPISVSEPEIDDWLDIKE